LTTKKTALLLLRYYSAVSTSPFFATAATDGDENDRVVGIFESCAIDIFSPRRYEF